MMRITQKLIFLAFYVACVFSTELAGANVNIDPDKAQAHLEQLLARGFQGGVLEKDKFEEMGALITGTVSRYTVNGPVGEYTSVVSSYKITGTKKLTDGIEFTVHYRMIGILADYIELYPGVRVTTKKYKVISKNGTLFVDGWYSPYMGWKAAIAEIDKRTNKGWNTEKYQAAKNAVEYFAIRWKKKIDTKSIKHNDLIDLMYYDTNRGLAADGKELKDLLDTYSQNKLKLIRNAIFARKNYQFNTTWLDDFYTKTYPGYKPLTQSVELTKIDKENIQYLLGIEKGKGDVDVKGNPELSVPTIVSSLLKKDFEHLGLMSPDDLPPYDREMFYVFYKHNPGWIFGDFNGDRHSDIALIGINRSGGEGAEFIIYSGNQKGNYDLAYHEYISESHRGIFLLPISRGETPRASIKKVKFSTLSIRLVYAGNLIEDYFYWDNKKNKFSKIRNDRNKR